MTNSITLDTDLLFDLSKGSVRAEAVETVERALYRQAMKKCRYNQTQAAKLLGVSRWKFRERLVKYFGGEFVQQDTLYNG